MATISDDLLKVMYVRTVASRIEIGVTISTKSGNPIRIEWKKLDQPPESILSSSAKATKVRATVISEKAQDPKKIKNSLPIYKLIRFIYF